MNIEFEQEFNKYFKMYELLPPEMYEYFGGKGFELFDKLLLIDLLNLRKILNQSLIINDWWWKGHIKHRGLRSWNCPIGGKESMHKVGRAIDFVATKMSAEEIRAFIVKNSRRFPAIKRIEGGVNWVHIDSKEHEHPGIYIFHK